MEEEKIARKLRNWFPGATYHLMERGIRRLAIFQDEMDFEVFLEILKKEAMEKGQTIAQIADALEESEEKIREVVDLLQKD